MASRNIDEKTYRLLVEAFRDLGTNVAGVAKRTGCSRTMVRRAFTHGWPEKHSWARPIAPELDLDARRARAKLADREAKVDAVVLLEAADLALREEVAKESYSKKEAARLAKEAEKARRLADIRQRAQLVVLERNTAAEKAEQEAEEHRRSIAEQALREREEAARRRAEAEAAEEAEREKARQQAVEARTQEAQLVRLARGAAIGTLGGTMRLMPALAKLADQLRAAVDAGNIPAEKAATVINQISRTVKDATVAAQVVIELERLHLGAPQAIIGVVQHEVALEDAAQAVDEFAAAVARSKELGLVDTTTTALGGKSKVAQA